METYSSTGKTQLVSHLLFDALMYCYDNEKSNGVSIKVLYFPLEETKERIMIRFYSWLLMRLKKVRISPTDLRSSDNEKPLDANILEMLESEQIKDIAKYFEEHFVFIDETNPTGIYKSIVQYVQDNGTINNKIVYVKDDNGMPKEMELFDSYVPNNPNEYVLCVIDTINLVQQERGFSKKQTIDKLSEYCILVRNRFGVSPIVIQQQNTDNESTDSIKMGRTRPTSAGLGDSKYTAHDANIMLGIFSPFKFGLDSYLPDETGEAYNIRLLKDHFRTLEVCINREGEVGGIIGLFFDGATCTWQELPKPSDPAINKFYNYAKQLNQ